MKRIVLADDSATARAFVRRCLEVAGLAEAEITETADGKEALAALREKPTDLLVTDLTMPVMDGSELIEQIASISMLRHLPILVITSAGSPAKEAKLMQRGVTAVLPKPVTPIMMAEALTKAGLLPGDDA